MPASYVLDGLDPPAHYRLQTRTLQLEKHGPTRIVRDDVHRVHAHDRDTLPGVQKASEECE